MAEFKDRLNYALRKRNISPAELSRITGVNEGAISQYRAGAYKASQRNLEKLANALQVAIPWLMGGDVPMAESAPRSIPDGLEPLPNWVKKPLIGDIACGEPILALENIEDYVMVPDNIHCDFLLHCKGDSMINARILDGDLVMIRQQDDVENGEIAAVRIDGSVTLKRVYKYPGMVRLMSENPIYPPMDFNNGNCSDFAIIGKAVAFISTVR